MNWATKWNDMRPSTRQGKIPEPVQDPKLFAPTKVRVLRPFCVAGSRCEIGTEVSVPYHVALDLRNIGKAELVTKQ